MIVKNSLPKDVRERRVVGTTYRAPLFLTRIASTYGKLMRDCLSCSRKNIKSEADIAGVAQGSRGAPLLWARVAALLCRLTQGVFEPGRARLACYVDDPIVTLSGSRLVRDRHVALVNRTFERTLTHGWRSNSTLPNGISTGTPGA